MITLIVVLAAFAWLLLETDWMRVRLLVGALPQTIPVKETNRKWQFARFGDDCIVMPDRCYIDNCRQCKKPDNHRFAWRLPARLVKIAGSTINFKAGSCNLYRAKLLKDVIKAQKSKAFPTYDSPRGGARNYDNKGEIELLVDGKTVMAAGNGSGEYKRGMIKTALKPYTTRIGKHLIGLGEADRVK